MPRQGPVPRGGPEGRRWPLHGWIGLALVALCWPLNWGLGGARTQLLFFPLWLGYALSADALVVLRTGTSPLLRSPRRFAALFAASAAAWWLFELLNRRLGNWIYLGSDPVGDVGHFLLSTLSFSTVMPAVFTSAELVRSFAWTERFAAGPRVPAGPTYLAAYGLTGAAMLAALLAWPRIFYPLTWLSLIFLLEPVCRRLGRRSLLSHLERGDWRPAVALAAGALTCGFFWEMWNLYSWPKWIYDTPGTDFWHVFEMPLLGYFGYLPFGLELYTLAALLLPRGPVVRL